jgi:hypothetical protein
MSIAAAVTTAPVFVFLHKTVNVWVRYHIRKKQVQINCSALCICA